MTLLETERRGSMDDAPEERVDTGRSQFARWGVTPQDLLVLTAGALFAASTGPFMFGGWTPRMAAVFAGLPLGVVLLVRLAWRRDKPAVVAVGFLAWAVVGAVTSGAPWRSLLGQVDGNTQSVLILAGVFGFWAVARTMSPRGRELVGPVMVAALGASAAVGVLQIVMNIRTGLLTQVEGRATGLEGNAAYFSMTICGACAWSASVSVSAASARSRRLCLAAVVFFALAIGLSGTRVSIIALVVVCIAVCWKARSRRSLQVPVAVAVGVALSTLVQHIAQLGAGSAERFSSSGSEGRSALWKATFSGFTERPLLGWGVGRARPALQHHLSVGFVRVYQTDDIMSAWNDVHNVVLQMLVTTGIVGIVLLTLFVMWAMRRADFGLSLAVVAIAVNWLLQPSTTSSLMIAAIFLGASAARITAPPVSTGPSRRWLRLVTAGAATLGLLAGMLLVAADLHLRDTVLNGSRADVRSAAAWFGDDPFVVDFFILNSYGTDTAGDRAERHDLALREVAAEPDVPRWWNALAMTQWDLDDLAGMRVSINKALSLQPNHIRSWVQMTAYAKRVGDVHLEEIARAHACELGAPVC